METKNVVIAMLCASIVILSIATPISAIELENSGVSGEIDGTGAVTGSVSIDASTDRNGEAEIEASIEASVELVGPGSAECSQEGPVTHTVETELGTIVADVSADSSVNAAVAVVGDGSASADAYVGTTASLGESEVEIESEISSDAHVETDGGSASATASATGTTTGDGISYATGDATNGATSYAEVSGDTEANAAVSGTAGADSYAAVGSTDYAGHYLVEEDSYIESGSRAWSDGGSQASADSSANGEAYQDGQAENCARSATYAEGEVSTAVATQGVAEADSDVYIWSYGDAYKGTTDYAYVDVDSDIYAWTGASSGTDGIASAEAYADGDTGAAGSACTCVYSDTSAEGEVSTAVQTQGDAYADSDAYIWSYGWAEKDTDYAYVYEDSDIYAWTDAESGTDGKASAVFSADGDTGAAGSACGCVFLDTSAIGKISSAVQTEGPADAWSSSDIWSYGGAYNDTDEAYVYEDSYIWADSYADSDPDGKASADSASIGYTGAGGSACTCVYLDTSAIGKVSSAVQTEGDAYAYSDSEIWSYGDAYKDTDEAYVVAESEIWTESEADSDPDGKASAGSTSIGYTGAAGSACNCVFLDTSAIGVGSTGVQTQGDAYAYSESDIWSYGNASKDTDGAAYVEEESEIWTQSYAGSGTDGKASAGSTSIGYTGAAGSACGCVFSDTSAIGIGSTAVKTEGPANAWSGSDIWSYGEAYKDTDGAYVYEDSSINAGAHAGSEDCKASAESSAKGYTDAAGSACDCLDSWTNAKGAVQVKTETDGDAWITANARLTSDGWIVIGKQMGANSVIDTSAIAMHNSNSAGTATADGSTEAGASDSCTNEWVGTGILDGEGETIVNPFNLMYTNAYAGFAYANAIPDGFEAIVLGFDINTLGPTENWGYSSIEAIAMIPAP